MAKQPGQSIPSSTTGRPIMVLLDVLGKRWTLRILWELNTAEFATFRELRTRCEEVSPTLLNSRLKDLRELNLVSLTDQGYTLTAYGISLSKKLAPLDKWANDWADSLA